MNTSSHHRPASRTGLFRGMLRFVTMAALAVVAVYPTRARATITFDYGTVGANVLRLTGDVTRDQFTLTNPTASYSFISDTFVTYGNDATLSSSSVAIPPKQIGSSATIVNFDSTVLLAVNNGANTEFWLDRNVSFVSLDGGGYIESYPFGTGDYTITITGARTASTASFSGKIQNGGLGSLALTMNSAGFKQTLTSTQNSYTGATRVTAGTLCINGSLSNSPVTVNGGTLSGTGTVTGSVTVSSGTLAGGDATGTLKTGNLSMASASTLQVSFRSSSQFSSVQVTGTVSLGNATLAGSFIGGFTPLAGERYTLINNDGADAVVGTFAGISDGSTVTLAGNQFTINYSGGDGNDVVITALGAAAAPVISSTLTASGNYGTAISTYTITASNTPTSYNATNLPPGLSVDTGNGQITGTPTAAALTGSPYSVSISATNAGGTDTQTLVFTINKAVLTVYGVTASNKVYDGTTTASVSYSGAGLSGNVGADAVQADLGTASPNFSDRNVGTGKTVTITGITLSGAESSRYTLTDPTMTANITAKALTVTGLAGAASVYNGTTTATLSGTAALQATETAGTGTTSDGKPYAVDSVSLTGTAAGTFADRNVGTGKAITVTGLSLTGTGNSNYTLTQPTGLTANVTAKALTAPGLSATAKTYDGTTAVVLTGSAALQSAEAAGTGTTSDGKPYSGDTVSLTGAAAGAFADRHAGTAKAVTVTGLSLTGADAGNYSLTAPSPTANITAKALNVTGLSAVATRTYDGTAVAGLSGTAAFGTAETAGTGTTVDGLPYTVDTIAISGTAAGAFADRHVGSGKAITVTGITVTGANSSNYTVTQPTGLTAAITAKALTVNGLSAVATRTYDGTTVASLSGTAAFGTAETAGTGTTVDGLPYTVDTIAISGTAAGAFADRHVGTAKAITVTGVTVTGANSTNYTVTQPTGFTAAITAKALNVTGLSAVATRTYDGTTVAGLSGTAAFGTAETAGSGTTSDGLPYTVDTIAIGGTAAGAFADRNVGSGKAITVTGITVTGANSTNYTVTQPTGLTAAITAKALAVSGLTAIDKIYDATTAAPLGGAASFAVAETAGSGTTSDGKPYTVDTIAIGGTAAGAFADRNVAAGKAVTVTGVTVTGTDSSNYTVTQQAGLTATITAKTLTVSGVTASSKTYDGTTTAALTGTPALATAQAPGAGTTADGNPYTGDTVSTTGAMSGAFADRHAGTGKTVTVSGLTLTGAQAGNYVLGGLTATADITAKALTVNGLSAVATRTYDATTVAGLTGTAAFGTAETAGSGTTSDGLPYTIDTIAIGGTAAGAFADRHAGTAKAITVTGITVTGANSSNYTVTHPTGLTADITAKPLSIAGVTAVATRIYDGTTTAGLTGTAALLSAQAPGAGTTADGKPYTGDTISLSGTPAGAFATRHVGTAKPITVTGLSLTGAENANYTVTHPAGLTADVTTKALSVIGLSAVATRTYDGSLTAGLTGTAALLASEAPGSGTTADGIRYTGDTVSLSGAATGAFATKTVGAGKAITVSGLTLTGAESTNYTVTQPTGLTANVTTKAITVTGLTVANKVYDGNLTGTPTYTGASLVGVVSGDTVTFVSASGTATFATKTVGTAKTVTFASLTLAGSDSANYTLTQPTVTADITAKTLTVTGITAANKTYNGTTAATLSTGSAQLVGVVSGDTVNLNTGGVVGTFADPNAGGGKTVTITGLTISGADNGNYALTQPTATATITPATATVAITNTEQTYDGQPKPVTLTVSPSVSTTVLYAGSLTVPTNAGTYPVAATVSAQNFSGGAAATLTIAKAPQTVSLAIVGGNFTVGTSHALTATATSGGSITYTVVAGAASLAGSTVTVTQAGPVTIRATQAGTDNYLAATAEQSFTGVAAGKQDQTISFAALPNRSTDSGAFSLSATASSGLVVTYTVVSGPASMSGSSGVVLTGSPGIVTIRASQAGNATYNAAADVLRSFLVTQPVPDIFFGDLSDEANAADGRGELLAMGGARLAAKAGDVAAAIYAGTRRGLLLIVSPTKNLTVSIDFDLQSDNTYTAPFTSGGRNLVVSGSLNAGALTGRITGLQVNFTTPLQSRVGAVSNLAGVYESDTVNSANGGTATIVSATGQILVVANVGSLSAGATGTVAASGTFSLTGANAVIAGSVDAPTTTVTGSITPIGGSAVGFASRSTLVATTDRLVNLSSRVRIAPARAVITGFVIGGTQAKKVLIRGVGPALAGFGVTGTLSNPKLTLLDAKGQLVAENDDWSGADVSAAFGQVGAFALPAGSRDAAILATLTPGAYTAQITGAADTGAALVEIYDASASPSAEIQRLINISTRGTVDVGSDGLLIGGFVITGDSPKKVLIRGVGPGLAAFGVTGTLVDPQLSVFSGSTLIARNDDWSTPTPLTATQTTASAPELAAAAQTVGAFGLGAGSKDAALIITLAPGAYTAQITGANAATGTAIVEVYELP